MKIHTRHVLGGFLGLLLLCVACIVVIFVVIDFVGNSKTWLARPPKEVVQYYLDYLPHILYLILPIAGMLPLERHIRWVEHLHMGTKMVEELVDGIADLAAVFVRSPKFAKLVKLLGSKGRAIALLGRGVSAISVVAKLGADQLAEMNAEALAKKDYMTAVLTGFRMDLDAAEDRRVLLRSKK